MSVFLNREEDSSRVRLDGVLDISDAAELKAVLLEALGRAKPVEVALDGASSLDVTAVQLLWAARREAETKAVPFHFAGDVAEAVSAALADVGLKEHLAFSQNG